MNDAINETLREYEEETSNGMNSEDFSCTCIQSECIPEERFCKCAVESSARFSLRVMEAMRSLQRDDELLPTSSTSDIVNYIEENYRNDGDLYAQVLTALKQVCSQGFAVELLENEYHLIGPIASLMNQNDSKHRDDCLSFSEAFYSSERKRGNDANSATEYRLDKRRKLNGRRENNCDCDAKEDCERLRRYRGEDSRGKTSVSRSNRNDDIRKGEKTDSTESTTEAEDSVYQELLAGNKSKRSETRERELRNWIRRCRRECERRRPRENKLP